ncbi:MAG TPA: response regulator [Magnetospirillaceae bacterium]|nr:response regulator [Magnetospirillaceae bacterium]
MRPVILCVDDEAVILMALKLLLKGSLGNEYRIETAFNAAEALDILEDSRREGNDVRLLITDWLMPGRKGDDLIRDARTIHPGLKAILVTGHADKEVLAALDREDLVHQVFRKPWSDWMLLSAVRECLVVG